MSISKNEYVNEIRANSAYPVYRGFIGTIALLGYLMAAATGFAALVSGLGAIRLSSLYGLALLIGGGMVALLIFLLARFFKEAALILADIGDSTADANFRVQAGQ